MRQTKQGAFRQQIARAPGASFTPAPFHMLVGFGKEGEPSKRRELGARVSPRRFASQPQSFLWRKNEHFGNCAQSSAPFNTSSLTHISNQGKRLTLSGGPAWLEEYCEWRYLGGMRVCSRKSSIFRKSVFSSLLNTKNGGLVPGARSFSSSGFLKSKKTENTHSF